VPKRPSRIPAPGTPFTHGFDASIPVIARVVVAYYDKYQPDKKDRVDSHDGLRDQTGGFQLVRVEKSEPLHLEALVKERDGSKLRHGKDRRQ